MATDENERTEESSDSSGNLDAAHSDLVAPRKRRLAELAAMAAVILAAAAVAVALLGQSPAKATSKSPAGSSKAAATASALLAAAKAPPLSCSGTVPKLTVQGTGMATGTPDLLTLVAQVNVTDSSAQQSLADDNARTAAVESALRSDGVQAKDIQTTNLSIQPNYTWTNNSERLTGYAVNDTISANFHAPFANAGKAIDDITGIAGNDMQIEGLNFSFKDPRVVEDQARTDAVTQAVSHAQSMAAAAGEQLGPVCSVTDNSAIQPYIPQPYANYATGQASAAKTQTPLQPGSQQETDQVTVVYALKPIS